MQVSAADLEATVIEVRHPSHPESADPEALILVERSERERGDDRLLTLSVRRIGKHPLASCNRFSWTACYSPAGYGNPERVKLTDSKCSAGGNLVMTMTDLLGHRIGTFLMTEIVAWARQWPSAEVMQIKLAWKDEQPDAWDGHNKPRRDRFYGQFGINFEACVPGGYFTAVSKPMVAGELISEAAESACGENIRQHTVLDWMSGQQREVVTLKHRVQMLEAAADQAHEERERIDRNPLRHALLLIAASPYAWGVAVAGGVAITLAKGMG